MRRYIMLTNYEIDTPVIIFIDSIVLISVDEDEITYINTQGIDVRVKENMNEVLEMINKMEQNEKK